MPIYVVLIVAALGETPVIDFDTDIVPRLTKAGCNAAACHGSAAGRGGFKLSLFGGDPASDYRAIVNEVAGRRVNPTRPADSLLLQKPTGQLDHGGGVRFSDESETARQLERWIQSGVPRTPHRRLKSLAVNTLDLTFPSLPGKARLRVTATFQSGSKTTAKDVSHLAVYTALDKASVQVTQLGAITLLRPGLHHVVVQFIDQLKIVSLWSPIGKTAAGRTATKKRQAHHWIDYEINAVNERLRLPLALPAKPHELLRRVTLDLTGRLPSRKALRNYLANGKEHRYQSYVDELLSSPAFNDYWTFRFAKLLRIQSQPRDTTGARTFHTWVGQQLKRDAGLDEIARSLLTARGDSHAVGPANFYRVVRGPRKQAEFVSESLLGVRLRCANCHNHPLDRWTQDDYHGLAAIFSKVQQGRFIRVKSSGSVIHPRTGANAVPRIPGERNLRAGADERKEFARWLTDRDNQYFATAQTNRIWKALMGRGLFEPTDDLRATNPPTHPALLRRLSRYFIDNGYSLRKLVRVIVMSDAYRRSNRVAHRFANTEKFYSHAIGRHLEAEVLADAIADVTGVPMRYGREPVGTRAVQLFDSRIRSPTLDILGRCSRMGSCETSPDGGGGLAQRLHMINGPLLNRRITGQNSYLQKQIQAGVATADIVRDFYERSLTRPPAARESRFWAAELDGKDKEERRRRLEDFVWSLLTSREFRTNR